MNGGTSRIERRRIKRSHRHDMLFLVEKWILRYLNADAILHASYKYFLAGLAEPWT